MMQARAAVSQAPLRTGMKNRQYGTGSRAVRHCQSGTGSAELRHCQSRTGSTAVRDRQSHTRSRGRPRNTGISPSDAPNTCSGFLTAHVRPTGHRKPFLPCWLCPSTKPLPGHWPVSGEGKCILTEDCIMGPDSLKNFPGPTERPRANLAP